MKSYGFKDVKPMIAKSAYLQAGVKIEGDVIIEDDVSIWYNATIRGDLSKIILKKGCNVQELTSIHSDPPFDVVIGENTTIGHNCVIHGAKIGSNTLIGMGAILLNGCEIGDNCLVAAGSLITQNTKFPAGSMIMGSPAKLVRELRVEEIQTVIENGKHYLELAKEHQKEEG